MSPSDSPPVVILEVRRQCLVCDWVEDRREGAQTDVIGPPCGRCGAPTERIAVLGRTASDREKNPHAVALGRLGGLKGGPARAAALTPKRRRDIAVAAAHARWRERDTESG